MTDIAEAKDIGKTLQLSCYLSEGVFTRHDVFDDSGKKLYAGKYASELEAGDIVQVKTDSAAGDGCIVVADYSDSARGETSASMGDIGKILTTPEGRIPRVASDGGTYTASDRSDYQRRATVEFYGFSVVRAFVIKEVNYAGTLVGWDYSETAMSSAMNQLPYVLLESASEGGTHSVMM